MALKGDLESIDLAHVFQMLTWGEKTGTLEIRSKGAKTCLFFQERGVLFPFDREAFPQKVLLSLCRHGRVDEQDLARATQTARSRDAELLSVLVEMQSLSQEELDAAFREQMEEEIYDLFFVTDATFEFLEDQKPDAPGKILEPRYALPPQGLVMEAARRIDEWNYIREKIKSDECIFEPCIRPGATRR